MDGRMGRKVDFLEDGLSFHIFPLILESSDAIGNISSHASCMRLHRSLSVVPRIQGQHVGI